MTYIGFHNIVPSSSLALRFSWLFYHAYRLFSTNVNVNIVKKALQVEQTLLRSVMVKRLDEDIILQEERQF